LERTSPQPRGGSGGGSPPKPYPLRPDPWGGGGVRGLHLPQPIPRPRVQPRQQQREAGPAVAEHRPGQVLDGRDAERRGHVDRRDGPGHERLGDGYGVLDRARQVLGREAALAVRLLEEAADEERRDAAVAIERKRVVL